MINDNPRSRSFIDLCPMSLRFNILKLLFLKTYEAVWSNFYMEPSWDVVWNCVEMFRITWPRWLPGPYMVKNLFKLWHWVDLDHFYDMVRFVSKCFCTGESLCRIESCISKLVRIQHILSSQVSDTGQMVLWFLVLYKYRAFIWNYMYFTLILSQGFRNNQITNY